MSVFSPYLRPGFADVLDEAFGADDDDLDDVALDALLRDVEDVEGVEDEEEAEEDEEEDDEEEVAKTPGKMRLPKLFLPRGRQGGGSSVASIAKSKKKKKKKKGFSCDKARVAVHVLVRKMWRLPLFSDERKEIEKRVNALKAKMRGRGCPSVPWI